MNGFLERNLLALSGSDPELASRIQSASPDPRLTREASRSGPPVPVLLRETGSLALNSRMDPLREAERIAEAYPEGGFLVFLGMGAGYSIRPFLGRGSMGGALVIEYSLPYVRSILELFDLAPVLSDGRIRLLVDPGEDELERALVEAYIPILTGDLFTVPLRARVDADPAPFSRAAEIVRRVLSRVSDDYSVQAFFGRRWFSNTVRNLKAAEKAVRPLPPVREAVVTAAGPSLDDLHSSIEGERKGRFLIATDTSMGSLLARGILPDAVVSIDCQHISYYHFLTPVPKEVPLIVDLASPPSVVRSARILHFFSSGHPFCRYISSHFRPFPSLDTSGGNVTHAAVSFAEALGARRILLFGADFSYPFGASYARGTYIHRYFRIRSKRTRPLESHFASFLYRNNQVDREEDGDGSFRYVTKPLQAYKRRLEAFASTLTARLEPIRGHGVEIRAGSPAAEPGGIRPPITLFAPGRPSCTAVEFLKNYRDGLCALSSLQSPPALHLRRLSPRDQDLWTTLLPSAAALRRSMGKEAPGPGELMERTRRWAVDIIASELDVWA